MNWRRQLCHMVAAAEGGVIGADGRMPWHVPEDLAYFKQTTWGHVVVMGRRTFDSIARKPLPGRLNIVLSRQEEPGARSDTLIFCPDWASAEACGQAASARWGDRLFIIGGGTLYRETAAFVERVYLTRLGTKVPGDTFYPLDLVATWHLRHAKAGTSTAFPVRFEVYDRPSQHEVV